MISDGDKQQAKRRWQTRAVQRSEMANSRPPRCFELGCISVACGKSLTNGETNGEPLGVSETSNIRSFRKFNKRRNNGEPLGVSETSNIRSFRNAEHAARAGVAPALSPTACTAALVLKGAGAKQMLHRGPEIHCLCPGGEVGV